MTWISLVCLLALSSAALARPYGGGYGSSVVQPMTPTVTSMRTLQPVIQTFPPSVPSSYGGGESEIRTLTPTIQTFQPSVPSSYGGSESQIRTLKPTSRTFEPSFPSSYGGGESEIRAFKPTIQTFQPSLPSSYGGETEIRTLPPQPQPATLPPTDADNLCRGQQAETVIPIENNRKFVVCLDDGKGVEQSCPKGLFYHEGTKRCERNLGPLPNACVSQPCLNGGQCVPVDSHYQCQCASGFDGSNCELDARVCQTQQPCGQSPDTRCQSFRLGAALNFVCIFQGGYAYGFNPQQALSSPCKDLDGPQALANSDKGFIMCDGERMSIESCPGGTIWDDSNKACVWPDIPITEQQEFSVESKTIMGLKTSSYGDSYGTSVLPPPPPPKTFVPRVNNYGASILPPPPPPKTFVPRVNNYGASVLPPPQPFVPRVNNYGASVLPPPPPPQPFVPRVNNYGASVLPPPPPPQPFVPRVNNYGASVLPPPPPPPKVNPPSGY